MIQFYRFIILTLLFSSCAEPTQEEKNIPSVQVPVDTSSIKTKADLLIFKQEKTIELWRNLESGQWKKMEAFGAKDIHSLPVGIFTFNHEQQSIEFPGTFYAKKQQIYSQADLIDIPKENMLLERFILSDDHLKTNQYQIEQVVIFPSDLGNKEIFEPCFACPHWISEVYATLDAQFKFYKKN